MIKFTTDENEINIYREDAMRAKNGKYRGAFVLIQDLQAFLRDLCAFAVPRFRFPLVRVRADRNKINELQVVRPQPAPLPTA